MKMSRLPDRGQLLLLTKVAGPLLVVTCRGAVIVVGVLGPRRRPVNTSLLQLFSFACNSMLPLPDARPCDKIAVCKARCKKFSLS